MNWKSRKLEFDIPEGIFYLDGNSLGPLPKNAMHAAEQTIRHEWGDMLITAWNRAGWMDWPRRLGNQIAPIIGAPSETVIVGDTLSIKLFQALSAARKLRPNRHKIITDSGNFPSDLYVAQGLTRALKDCELIIVDPEAVYESIDEDTAIVMLTHVDYRSARMHDMNALTQHAQSKGAIVIWDLAHSAGALPIHIKQSGAEFAVGCTYKYLNGGPGAPAFLYAHPDIITKTHPDLAAWLGHEAPFAFDREYRPHSGIDRYRLGTPSIIQMAVLHAALALWDDVDMNALHNASIDLSQKLCASIKALDCGLELASPSDPHARGSHVSFAHPHAYAITQALIAHGVIGDFRAPNLLRLGIAPLYNNQNDIDRAVEVLKYVMEEQEYLLGIYQTRHDVT